jgi:hypothetical protein
MSEVKKREGLPIKTVSFNYISEIIAIHKITVNLILLVIPKYFMPPFMC